MRRMSYTIVKSYPFVVITPLPMGEGQGGGASYVCFYFFLISVNPSRSGRITFSIRSSLAIKVIETADANRFVGRGRRLGR